VEQLQGFLFMDMGRAVAYLDQVLNALAAYRGVAPAHAPPRPANQPDETENPK